MDLIGKPNEEQKNSDKTHKWYSVVGGKLKETEHVPKTTIDFSNWYGGNADPEDLRKHRELLDRSCFKGPFWENRPRNPSILDEKNPKF